MTFLSVYTPTYKRPQALARCKRVTHETASRGEVDIEY